MIEWRRFDLEAQIYDGALKKTEIGSERPAQRKREPIVGEARPTRRHPGRRLLRIPLGRKSSYDFSSHDLSVGSLAACRSYFEKP